MDTKTLVAHAYQQRATDFEAGFGAAMQERIGAAVEARRETVAQNILSKAADADD